MPRIVNSIFFESFFLLALNYVSPVLFILCALIWFWPTAKRKFVEAIMGVIMRFLPADKAEEEINEDDGGTIDKNSEVLSSEDCNNSSSDSVSDDLWINKIISRLWTTCLLPHVTKELCETLRNDFYEDLASKHPKVARFMREIEIEEVCLGECPVKVTKITAANSKYLIVLKIGIHYPGNGSFSIKWSHPEFHASIQNFEVSLPLEIILGP